MEQGATVPNGQTQGRILVAVIVVVIIIALVAYFKFLKNNGLLKTAFIFGGIISVIYAIKD